VSYYSARRSVGFATVLAAAPQRLLSGLGGFQSGVAASVAPIAQTACGVGGAALIGVCLGTSALPHTSTATADRDGDRQEVAAQTTTLATVPTPENRAGRGHSHRRVRSKESGGEQDTVTSPTQGSEPRSLVSAPTGGGGSTNTGGGNTGPTGTGVDATVPDVPKTPELPALPQLPDVRTLLDPVTDVVPLPDVQVPAPLPQVGLP
jgi:hypothetical protein